MWEVDLEQEGTLIPALQEMADRIDELLQRPPQVIGNLDPAAFRGEVNDLIQQAVAGQVPDAQMRQQIVDLRDRFDQFEVRLARLEAQFRGTLRLAWANPPEPPQPPAPPTP